MSAQQGGAILLAYRTQPEQSQAGGAILLEYAHAADTTRRLYAGTRAPWSTAQARASDWQAPMATTTQLDKGRRAPWLITQPQGTPARVPWGVSSQRDAERAAPWGRYGQHQGSGLASTWLLAHTADQGRHAPWSAFGTRPSMAAAALWLVARALDETSRAPWGRYARRSGAALAAVTPATQHADHGRTIIWVRYSRPLAPGWGVPSPDGGPTTDENGTIIVPVRRVYMSSNSASLMRADNAQPIQVLEMSVGIDAYSWAWSFQATLPASEYSAVCPAAGGDPLEVEVVINDWPFRALVEQVRRTRRFGQHAVTVQGRSPSAWLAAPYAASSSRDNASGAITAQQIIDAALLNTGWTLDWQITDWLVPAGAWAHTGTPLEVATRIAEAAGAYVQTDPNLTILRVLPRYPAMPWEWAEATPDIELPPDVLTEDGIELRERPHYNRVFVSGTTQGVLGQITRTGTAGDRVAPLITDPLITHADAARQRGRSILGDTGRQYHTTLTLPITDDTDLLLPGLLIAGTEGAGWRGLTRSLSVRANREGDALRVRQSVEVERHEEEPQA